MSIKIFSGNLTFSRLKIIYEQYFADGLITLDTRFSITREQFNNLANDAMMNSHLNGFFAEGVKIMHDNNIQYTDLNLINLYLQKNNIAQVEITND